MRIDHRPLDVSSSLLARQVRLAGDHAVKRIFRRGEPVSYAVALADFGARHHLDLPTDPEAAELAVLRWWMDRFWDRLRPEEQQRLWSLMHGAAPVPTAGAEALARIDPNDPHGYLVTRPGLEVLLLSLVPMGGCMTVWLMGRPRDDRFLPAVLEVAKLRRSIRYRVTVGVVGSPSCGKDAAIAAIFGIESGNISPIAGSTRTVEISQLPDATALYVVNTPGMGDVVEQVTEAAREVLELIDVFVYVLNSQGGVQARELADYQRCVASGRPVLVVVNKIDTLREEDRERYLADARQKLGAAPENFLAAAFDPHPQLHDQPLGLQPVRDWIARELTGLGKDRSELPW